ncbi:MULTISPECIES: hypothetical protein [unclassified Agrococcus]|uniref:hypothetical protein n=1 Tax=unclassified Agrococcus TaxID=2615065 RepID=UPI003612A890
MTISPDHWVAVCEALDVDPEQTVSINISATYVRVVFADQATVSHPLSTADPIEPLDMPAAVPLVDTLGPVPSAPAPEEP